MKNIKFTNFKFSIIHEEGFRKDKETSMISPLNSKELKEFLRDKGWRLINPIFGTNKTVAKLQLLMRFGNYVHILAKRNGPQYAIKYLKAAQLAIQRSIAGTPVKSLSEIEPDYCFPRLSRSGLPVMIQLKDRRAIRSGSVKIIRFWLTAYNLYRILSMEFKPKLATITDGYQGDNGFLCEAEQWMKQFVSNHLPRFIKIPSLNENGLLKIWKASATQKIAWHGAYSDLLLLESQTRSEAWKGRTVIEWIDSLVTLINPKLKEQLDKVREVIKLRPVDKSREWGMNEPFLNESINLIHAQNNGRRFQWLGKLSPKEEAAGKLRIFALVDVWSQSALYQIHELLFAILRQLPNDGTFDQEQSVKRGAQKAKDSGEAYCFDLSAATDRLPISIQREALSGLLGSEVANCWEGILLARSYAMNPKQAYQYGLVKSDKDQLVVNYAVGQPMGAYSSWAMLALTHHLILQWCNRRVGKVAQWYDNYEVLGDDITIFDKKVADQYLEVIRQLGVGVNLSKSVISPTGSTIEFAKKTVNNETDVSGLSWKMVKSLADFASGRLGMAMFLARKGYGTVHKLLNMLLPSGKAYIGVNKPKWVRNALNKSFTGLVQRRAVTLEQLFKMLLATRGRHSWESSPWLPLSQTLPLVEESIKGVSNIWRKPYAYETRMTAERWQEIHMNLQAILGKRLLHELWLIDQMYIRDRVARHWYSMTASSTSTADIEAANWKRNARDWWVFLESLGECWFADPIEQLKLDLIKAKLIDEKLHPLDHSWLYGVTTLLGPKSDLWFKILSLTAQEILELLVKVQSFKASLETVKPEGQKAEEQVFSDVMHEVIRLTAKPRTDQDSLSKYETRRTITEYMDRDGSLKKFEQYERIPRHFAGQYLDITMDEMFDIS